MGVCACLVGKVHIRRHVGAWMCTRRQDWLAAVPRHALTCAYLKWCQESDQHWSARSSGSWHDWQGGGRGGRGGGASGRGQHRKDATLAQIAKAFRQDCRLDRAGSGVESCGEWC